MTYPYLAITPTLRRPIIEIIIKSKDKFAIYPVLIDSGADYCIFDIEIARVFRIKLSKQVVKFRGIGKDQVIGRWGEIEIRVASRRYQAKVLFAQMHQFSHGVLGQLEFFDHFDVKLSHHKQIIEIEPIKYSN